jgi:exopolysaccharide production protein ExoZ
LAHELVVTRPRASASGKLDGIQVARAIAACFVVACHLPGYETKYLTGPSVAPSVCQFGMAGVDLYFVISGFIITTMCAGRFGREGEASRFLVQRAVRIYPVYWFWCLAVLAVFMLHPGMVNSSHGPPDVVRSLLLLPQRNLPLLLVSWTLVYELFFYLLFAVVLRWLRNSDLTWFLLAWAAFVIAGRVILAPGADQPLLELVVSPLLLEFILGCLVALYAGSLSRRAALTSLIVGAAGFIAGSTVLAVHGDAFPLGWWRVLIYGTSSAFLVAGIVSLERASDRRPPRPLVALGDASYSLYLSHVPVIAVAGLAWQRIVAAGTPAAHVAALMSGFAVALAAGMASFHLVELPLLRASRRLASASVARVAAIRQASSG